MSTAHTTQAGAPKPCASQECLHRFSTLNPKAPTDDSRGAKCATVQLTVQPESVQWCAFRLKWGSNGTRSPVQTQAPRAGKLP